MAEVITSPSNPKIKRLLALQQKSSARREAGLFVVEGQRELQHCLDAGFEIDTIFVCPEVEAAAASENRSHPRLRKREGPAGLWLDAASLLAGSRSKDSGRGPAQPDVCRGELPAGVKEVQTFYEQLFLEQGYPITYLSFVIDHEGPFVSPRDPEQFDSKAWRAAEGPRLLFGHDSAETRRQKLHSTEA